MYNASLTQICTNCHSTNGPNAAAGTNYQIPVTLAQPPASVPGGSGVLGVAATFNNHHPEGDEYRTSPHQNMGCTSFGDQYTTGVTTPTFSCHDPHASVWHNDGGVAVGNVAFNNNADPSDPTYSGNMCLTCHGFNAAVPAQRADKTFVPQIRIRGAMGDIGLACIDCHMPEISAGGTRKAHIFKINATNLTAANNVYKNAVNSKVCLKGDAQDPNNPNSASLTLDMVCTACHDNMTMDQLAAEAVMIHRAPGMADLTINGDDSPQFVSISDKDPVSVNFSVAGGSLAGTPADWYVLRQGPKGWTSYQAVTKTTGSGKNKKTTTTNEWVSGTKPWISHTSTATGAMSPLLPADPSETNVLNVPSLPNASLPAGMYIYWVRIVPWINKGTTSKPIWVKNGAEDNVSVILSVSP
ncbi:MAG: hypothetical protein ACLQNE_44505 [Thermoguttaceae bacterium]